MLAALQAALAREPLIVAAALTTPDQRVTATGGARTAGLAGPGRGPAGRRDPRDGAGGRDRRRSASAGADPARGDAAARRGAAGRPRGCG